MEKASVLARGFFNSLRGKTAHGLIRHGKKYRIIEVVDETLKGRDAGEVMGNGYRGIPIVADFSKDVGTLIIGVAPPGGRLPKEWRKDIINAIKNRMNIVSGLHDFLSDDKEFSELAKRYNVKIWDVRKPPKNLSIAKGFKSEKTVVLVLGTDSSVGKRTTALELVKSAEKKGFDTGFVATGQTGIIIGADAGIAVDAVPSDFVSGVVEKMVMDVSKNKEMVFVEGQGAISHPAYGSVALGILYGAKPDYVIMVHAPARKNMSSFPKKISRLEDEVGLIEKLGKTKVVGLSLNCGNIENWEETVKEYEEKTCLPTVDVIKQNADRLLKEIINHIKREKR
ncbi:MAG: DUF1611 domain-containing protein [Candidatus Thermoplasmatota archaeon]|nr:DUF1611 domain-containing protein [Candidatus Thermoplasmatota archaeon]MBU4256236.1 DUF1611 domain-containing protein [Candidatus Thermoplasmatota archaeon]MCG2826702.1 DUF1611 domain-containing protein [Thermoplasmatales archaeon]